MKRQTTLFYLLAALVVTGCSNTSSVTSDSESSLTSLGISNQERVNRAIDIGAIAIYQSKGTIVNPTRTNTHEASDGAISVATSVNVEEVAVALDWTLSPSNLGTIGAPDITGRRLVSFVFPSAGNFTNVTLKVTATYLDASATLDYLFRLETPASTSASTSQIPAGTLKTIAEARALTAGTQNIIVEGFVTSVMADGNNLTIQQGGLALGVFNPVAAGSNQRPYNFQFGDYIRVRGTFDIFNGLKQIRVGVANGFIESATAPSDPEPLTFYEITAQDWAAGATGNLLDKDSLLVKMTDLQYVSGLNTWTPTAGVHYTGLLFRKGNTDVKFYINYHILLTNMTAIQTLIANNPNALFTYQGALNWSNGPSISPMNAGELTVQS
jgi:hypothetical protein